MALVGLLLARHNAKIYQSNNPLKSNIMFKVEGLKTALLNVHGKPYQNDAGQYGYVIVDALGGLDKATGKEKIDAYALALKLNDADSIELEKADVALIKKAIEGMNLPAHLYAQLMSKLEEPVK